MSYQKNKQTHGRSGGFTLVELMVAMTGGIFFTVFVFMMSKDSARFFQGQSRLSETTLAAATGFERLRADIARAGFLSSPNLYRDQNRCPRPIEGTPPAPEQNGGFVDNPGLQQMALAQVFQGGSEDDSNFMLTDNAGGLSPDQLILWGNYTSADQFPVRAWATGTFSLEVGSPGLIRAGITGADMTEDTAALGRLFPAGSIIRVSDSQGRDQYTIVSGVRMVVESTGNVPTVDYVNTVGLIAKASGNRCGIRGIGRDLSINPVNIIRYRLRNLQDDPAFDALYVGAAGASDSTRLDLVREELGADASVQTNTSILSTEVVAEYAVDLKFGLTVQSDPAFGTLTYLGEDDPLIPRYAGISFTGAAAALNSGPHWIRGIHARLAVRNRDPDRVAPVIPADSDPNSEDLLRVQVAQGEYARMRSLRSHIATRNSRNEMWN